MLKSFFLTALLVVTLTLFIAPPTFSSSLFSKTQLIAEATPNSPLRLGSDSQNAAKTEIKNTVKANGNRLDCTKTANDAARVNLDTSCEKTEAVVTPRATYPQPPHPYDTEAIKQFNEELYGAGN